MLTEQRKQARRQWVAARGRWNIAQWSEILFSDESRFAMSHANGKARVWRRAGERFADACVMERDRWGGPSVMVWAGITATHRTDLQFVEGNLTGVQ